MRLSDRLRPGESADDLMRDVLNVTLAGLQSGIPLASNPAWTEAETESSVKVS
jgi:hypothetical protein